MADEWKGGDAEELREQDRFLPIANISRIMKKSLPDAAKIAKDAKETVQECVSEFICFITSEASDKCQQEKRKTINGEDILWAMSTLGFDKYVEPLKLYLAKYRESVKGEKPEKKPRREEESGGGGSMAAAAGAAAAGNSAAYAAAYAAAAAAAAAAASSQPAGG
ncbi:nuclear transcription factor Y subunit B4, partial [Tribonema minus]